MKLTKTVSKKTLSVILVLAMLLSMTSMLAMTATAVTGTNITYSFSGSDKDTAGYAQGTVTLSSDTAGTYYLYWADDSNALDGYYPIDELTLSAGGSASYEFDYHTAIPAGATKIIATTSESDTSVANAAAVYSIPESKQLLTSSGSLLYTFNSYSDVHIDRDSNGIYYKNAETNWAQALKYGVDMDTDFIVSSGDMVTNATGPDTEWLVYEQILADSDYVNPVWESDGNHDMRSGVSSGLTSFVRASGTDSTIANYDANKPYYYVTEQSTGDLFIFMALENDSDPSSCDEFSSEQMAWLTNLLEENYGTGINIYIIEHSPIKGFGAGDRMDNPYYKAHLSEEYESTVEFKSLLQKYPDLIFMSGHTHEDFTMGYNYSNEDGTACNMIHNPAVAGSTWASESATSLDYNDGYGYNSQGYYVETYENEIVYYGANLTDELIYPAYCYIMEGSNSSTPEDTNETDPIETATTTATTGATVAPGTETTFYYFANTLGWETVDCYSWSDSDISTCVWPGYAATYYGTSEQGVELYYCAVPSSHDYIIWNNGGNGYQTANITLDGTNNFFTPSTTTSSKSVTVTASVWDYDVPETSEATTASQAETTNPDETTETGDSTATQDPSETSDTGDSSDTEDTSDSEESSDTTETQDPSQTESTVEPPEQYSLGDVDRDGRISVKDATLIQKYLVLFVELDSEQLTLADVNSDENVNISDTTAIQKYVAELITEFTSSASQSAVSKVKAGLYSSGSTTLSQILAEAKTALDDNYTFSSYDQYQALKKLYYQYKSASSASDTVIAEFETLIADLTEIVDHIGATVVYDVGDIYYFENTYDWSTVNCYAWTGSSVYGSSWPGLEMELVGTNNGHNVYGVHFEYAGQYANLIFNNGESGYQNQTVNIALNAYAGNCFYLDGTTDSSGKQNVGNYEYESSVIPSTVPTSASVSVSDDELYALCYYCDGSHAWATIDTFFTPQGDGTYVLNFTTVSTENISLNVYNNSTSTYNCVSSSTPLTYTAGTSQTCSLAGSSSRGKSITISGLSSGVRLQFIYNPSANTLAIYM